MALVNKFWTGCVVGALMFAACSTTVWAQPAGAGRDDGHGFDFGIGTFKTHIRRLDHPLSGSTTWTEWNGTVVTRKIWDGGGNLEELNASSAKGQFQGLTLRLYNATTHQWKLYWVGSDDGVVGTPMTGEFKQGRGVFYDKDTVGGRAVLVRDIYSGATANTYHFEEAFSPDNGKTWETHFIADLTREPSSAAQAASAAAEPAAQHDFDWQFGSWRIHMSRLQSPMTNAHTWTPLDGTVVVDKVWGGRANLAVIDTQGPSGRLQFLSLRLYNPKTHQWSLNFSTMGSGELGVPMVGAFKNGSGEFYNTDQWHGRPVLCRFIFSNLTGPSSEEQAFSADGGKTWEVNWINTAALGK
jgi:hypothetical protein